MIQNKKKNILIIGGIPEPIGGVTTHVWRLSNAIKNIYNTSLIDLFPSKRKYPNEGFKFFSAKNIVQKAWFICTSIMFGSYDIIHIHQSTVKNVIYLFPVLFTNKNKIIFTFHHGTLLNEFNSLSKLRKFISLLILKHSHGYIILSESQKLFYKKKQLLITHNYVETNSFLFPSDFEISSGIGKNKSDKIKISVSGFIKPEYRLVEAIEVFDKLVLKNKYLELHVFTYGPTDYDYEKKFYNRLNNRPDIIHHKDLNNQNFLDNLKDTDLFLRTFINDSCGLVVYEAINFGIPVIATNCCPRCQGTILYEIDEFDELYKKADWVINNLEVEKEKLENIALKDSLEKIINIYENEY